MDDLLDLNWSASPIPPASKSQSTLTPTGSGPSILTPNPITSKTYNASFDILSKPSSSVSHTPNYYSSTPLRAGTPQQPVTSAGAVAGGSGNGRTSAIPSSLSRSTTPLPKPSTPALNSTSAVPVATSQDAFSSLLSISSNSNVLGGKTMTMAERQAALIQEKKRQEEEERKRFQAEGDFWDNLGSGSSGGKAKSAVPAGNGHFDNLLQPTAGSSITRGIGPPPAQGKALNGTSAQPPAPTLKQTPSSGTFWDNYDDTDDLLGGPSKPSASGHPQTQSRSPDPPADFLDFDTLDLQANGLSIPPTQTNRNGSRTGSGMRTPVSDFDFGDREDNDDADILGDLGKPVQSKPQRTDAGPSRIFKKEASRSSSPPPHIVGQIVEMGFSPAQARQALAKTPTGVDVEAALELLLAGQSSQRDEDLGEADDDRVERERQRREEAEKERRRRRRAGPSRDSVKVQTPAERDDVQDVLAQASEIGQSVLYKATLFWNTGKERAAKIYEEKRKAYEASIAAAEGNADGARKAVKDGRPKWMVERDENGWNNEPPIHSSGGFRDDDDPTATSLQRTKPRSTSTAAGPSKAQQAPRLPQANGGEYRSTKERNDLLFADEEPKRYISPARHAKPQAKTSPAPSPPVPLQQRNLVPATPSQIQTSAAHKTKGNEHFKLGRFAEAASAYTTAISSLPEGHILLVPLHNNRAAARLKLGESSPAAEDCTTVLSIIGPTYHPDKEAPLPSDLAGEVKLADGMVKATIKRAQAWEMSEKWKKAAEDWEKVMSYDFTLLGNTAAATRNLASEGARRAKKMIDGDGEKVAGSTSASTSVAKPKPKPKPVANIKTSAITVDNSTAVAEMRKAAQAAEAEDDERFRLKDTIDTRINNWKNGKETNLRALIASLDTILWDGILSGGLKVGMHELVTDKQVKIKYMKVISRLHPDKLNTTNTTVEQRMLANGAFGVLSEAWQAFNK